VATLVLLRHGRTTSNAAGTLAGHQPTELDDTGRAQAAAVGARLAAAALAPTFVVTSPLIRCRQTIAIAMPECPAADEPRLVECDYGDWSGGSLKKLAKDPLWKVVQAHPSAATFPGGESMAAMSARAVAAALDWDARATSAAGPDAVVIACSHGDVIKAIVADALGLHLDQFQRIAVDPASLTVIRYTTVRPFLVRLNDVGGDLSMLRPPKRRHRRPASSDAVIGGGAGGAGPAAGIPAGGSGVVADDRIGSKA
jgi:probable phosphomutase (TIGR03848 family)